MKLFSISILIVLFSFSVNAQTTEELKKEQAPKKAEIEKLQGEINALQAKIDALPGWRIGAFGTVGGNLSGFKNWYSKTEPNSSAGNIGITINTFANLIKDDFFWRNSLGVNVGWVKIDDKDDPSDSANFETATDVFTVSSLYGKRLNKKLAFSVLGEYRTTLLDNFNNPGYLDLGAGLTWTPTKNLVAVIHPGNYNLVFSKAASIFESSLGAKIVADYTKKYGKLSVKSNVSVFQSYRTSDLSNWTWTNSFNYKLYKGIGVGFELGIRENKQETLNNALITDIDATFDSIENKLQSYWLLGMSYAF